jgi:hypothetical protein
MDFCRRPWANRGFESRRPDQKVSVKDLELSNSVTEPDIAERIQKVVQIAIPSASFALALPASIEAVSKNK